MAAIILVLCYFFLENYLSDYTQKGKTVSVPNVLNERVEDLPELLEKKGFRFEILDSTFIADKKKGIVLEQTPEAGDPVKEGRKIYVKINARTNKKIKLHLDNVIGGSKRQAEEVLASMDVKIDNNYEYKAAPHANLVLGIKDSKGKNLKSGDLVYAGSKLTMVISITGNEDVVVPNVIGLTIAEAEKEISKLNLNYSDLAEQVKCKELPKPATTKITKQQPEAGSIIKTGSRVSLFYDCDSI